MKKEIERQNHKYALIWAGILGFQMHSVILEE
jgi:hypothetical protein